LGHPFKKICIRSVETSIRSNGLVIRSEKNCLRSNGLIIRSVQTSIRLNGLVIRSEKKLHPFERLGHPFGTNIHPFRKTNSIRFEQLAQSVERLGSSVRKKVNQVLEHVASSVH